MRADISPIENQRSQTIYNIYNIYTHHRVIQSHVRYTCAHMNGCMCLCAKNAIVGFHGSLAFYCCSVLIEVCVVATERPDRGNQGAKQRSPSGIQATDQRSVGRSVGRAVSRRSFICSGAKSFSVGGGAISRKFRGVWQRPRS